MLKTNLKNRIKNEVSLKLNNKMFSIHVTNVCNLHCGGCDQFCGYFDKDKLFFIEVSELEKNIVSFLEYKKDNWSRSDFPEDDKVVLLYGGEPTLHPKFEEILKVLYKYEDIPFCIYTNGRTFVEHFSNIDLETSCKNICYEVYKTKTLPKNGYSKFNQVFKRFHAHDKNVAYRIDYKTHDVKDVFSPTLCAPVDLERKKISKLDYWKRASKDCYKWNCCESSIYRNKAYVCNVAASMDNMFYNGEHGWDVEDGKNPFLKTEEDINKQMENFCYRCGYNCLGGLEGFTESTEKTQFINKGSLSTATNKNVGQKSPQVYQLEIIKPVEKRIPPEVFR